MAFAIPGFQAVRSFMLAAFDGRFPGANVNRFGDIYKRLSVVSLGITDVHHALRQVSLDIWPDTARGEAHRRWLRVWGIPQRGASGSAASGALRVFGDVAASVPANEPLRHPSSGLQFETRSSAVIGASGYVDVDVGSTSTGLSTNLEAGEELEFTSPPAGIETTAKITIDLENGADIEDETSSIARLLNRIAEGQGGGNPNDWLQWILQSAPYVKTGYVYRHRNGAGTVDVAALRKGTGTARILTGTENDAVKAFLELIRPVTSFLRQLEVTPEPTDVDLCILPDLGPLYAFDWLDSTPPVVLTYDDATRILTFADDRPVSMAAGDRLIINDVSTLGVEWLIEELSGTDAVVLSEDAEIVADSQTVYSGGPLVQPIRTAIQAHFDELGTANPDALRYGAWEGSLRKLNILRAADIAGALDVEVITPASLVEASDPSFPANTSVGLLVSQMILVRSFVSEGL